MTLSYRFIETVMTVMIVCQIIPRKQEKQCRHRMTAGIVFAAFTVRHETVHE
jgi:hypothetical protein